MVRIIDELDARILELLQENARITQSDIAKAVGMAPSAVLERMRKLEARGAIREYVAVIDPHVAELPLLAFVSVRTSEYGPDQPSAHALAKIPEVLEVHHVAGDDCYLLKVRARDAEHLGHVAAAADRRRAACDVDTHHRGAGDDEGNQSNSDRRAQAARCRARRRATE